MRNNYAISHETEWCYTGYHHVCDVVKGLKIKKRVRLHHT